MPRPNYFVEILFAFTWLLMLPGLSAQISEEIQFTHDGKIVHGTFSKPSGNEKFPTIIICPGSGPNDRDGTLVIADSTSICLYPELANKTLRPYKQLSEALVDSGFAVLRYDKLEYTYTPAQLGTITFHKIWLPVESAIGYIKTRADVDTNCISLLGHSEGSLLVPYIALGRSDIKSLISVAGPITPFDSILAYQIVHFAALCDDDSINAAFSASQVLLYFHQVRITHGVGLPPFLGVPATEMYHYLQATEPVAMNYNSDNLPTLFVGFGHDYNVPPSELQRLMNEVTITDDFYSIPDIVHYMTPYNNPNISMVVTDTIIHWLKQQCMATAIHDEQYKKDDVLVYPNPFVDNIFIKFPQHQTMHVALTIKDMAGNILLNEVGVLFEDGIVQKLDLNFLIPGVYVLEIHSKDINVESLVVKK